MAALNCKFSAISRLDDLHHNQYQDAEIKCCFGHRNNFIPKDAQRQAGIMHRMCCGLTAFSKQYNPHNQENKQAQKPHTFGFSAKRR